MAHGDVLGAGVCHDYRTTEPEKKAWDKPGGRGPGVDRAVQPSKVVHVDEPETTIVNVTEDVSLWHRGLVPNEGWMLTVDDHGSYVRLSLAVEPERKRVDAAHYLRTEVTCGVSTDVAEQDEPTER